jgi:hypothetical protein
VLAYNIAALTGAAFVGKLKTFAEYNASDVNPNGAALLGVLFKMKRRGVPMQIEKVSLH